MLHDAGVECVSEQEQERAREAGKGKCKGRTLGGKAPPPTLACSRPGRACSGKILRRNALLQASTRENSGQRRWRRCNRVKTVKDTGGVRQRPMSEILGSFRFPPGQQAIHTLSH